MATATASHPYIIHRSGLISDRVTHITIGEVGPGSGARYKFPAFGVSIVWRARTGSERALQHLDWFTSRAAAAHAVWTHYREHETVLYTAGSVLL
jgi:hypothetical protein